MEFLDYKTITTIIHVLGVILGAGGAFMSDVMFASSIRDEKVTHTEMRFLRLGSIVVWIGLAIIIISGFLIFMTDPNGYLASHKFLAKMTIVAIIVVNGLVFHLIHIPRLHRHIGHHFPSSDEFERSVPILLMNGVISVVSWLAAFILGMMRGLPYNYATIMLTYAIVLALAIILTLTFRSHFVPRHEAKEK